MRSRTWPILALAFGTLIALVATSGLSALQRARRIFRDISALHTRHQEGERTLTEIRAEVNRSGVLVRDFLLDRSNLTAQSYREQLLAIRADIPHELERLRTIVGAGAPGNFERLRQELDGYWDSLDPIFEWTPEQKLALSFAFLRREVLPRRNAALEIAREIRDLNETNLERQKREILAKEDELPGYVTRMLSVTLLVSLLVAGGTMYRTTGLERRSESQRLRAESAEQEMRRLSQKLVRAQEDERRLVSRELHDEVGQMLTAQRMAIRNLKQLRTAAEEEFLANLEDMARLSEDALRAVRDIAMGLRPSMLDDFGLGPAIEWQAREVSRRCGVAVAVQLEGPLNLLPDSHRTTVYRVVQEALTNCVRHAQAQNVRIFVHEHGDRLALTIQDDGTGFDAAGRRGRGLGLLGIEERVRELGGRVSIISQPGKGTVLSADIPVQMETAST